MRRLTPIITDTAKLLTDVVASWHDLLGPEGPEQTSTEYDDRYSFGLALNIRDLLADVRCLYEAERIRGIRLIVRPLLESAFNLDCSFTVQDFPRTKSAGEFEDYIRRVNLWKKESKDRSGDAELDSMIQHMEGCLEELKQKFGTAKWDDWNAHKVAVNSRISNQYRSVFFGYSNFTHVTHISLPTEGKPEEADSSVMIIVHISLQAIGMVLEGKPTLNCESFQNRLIGLLEESKRIKQTWNYA